MIWTLDELAELLSAPLFGGGTGVTPVSRIITSAVEARPGDIYTPISSTSVGSDIQRAIANGAVAVLIQDQKVPDKIPAIRVPNIRNALTDLAAVARERFSGRIIGVTGSVGKTTTKDMLAHLLAHHGVTHFTDANLNSGNANLASVASLPSAAEFSVLEIAMMDLGSIGRKSSIAKPDVALITGIGFSHGVYHADGAASILNTKTDMFWHLAGLGVAVLPSQDRHYEGMLSRAHESGKVNRVISCGQRDNDNVQLLKHASHPTYSEVSIKAEGCAYEYVISQPGEHFVWNSLLAAGAMLAVGAPLSRLGALATYAPTRRRVERFRVPLRDGAIELIDDGYNAAPDSVRALLSLLGNRDKASRRILIFGDMLELGPEEVEHHLALAPDIDKARIDLLVTVGPNAEKLAHEVKTRTVSFPTAAAAASGVPSLLQSRDLVAVKGSNAMKLIRVVNALKGSAPLLRQGMHWSIEIEG